MTRKGNSLKVSITLRLQPEAHRDLIELLASSSNKANTVMEALYSMLYGGGGMLIEREDEDAKNSQAIESLLQSWEL